MAGIPSGSMLAPRVMTIINIKQVPCSFQFPSADFAANPVFTYYFFQNPVPYYAPFNVDNGSGRLTPAPKATSSHI